MSRDDLNDIPSFTAKRDEAVSSAPRGAIPARASRTEAVMGLTARLVLTIALVAAGIACSWAWQLQTLLDDALYQQKLTQGRVADLEALLSDTDETVNKSAAAMGAQLRLLDTEVRKLWDARKISNGKLAKLEKTGVTQEKQITNLNDKALTQTEQLASMQSELAALTIVAGDLERLASARSGHKATWRDWPMDSISPISSVRHSVSRSKAMQSGSSRLMRSGDRSTRTSPSWSQI